VTGVNRPPAMRLIGFAIALVVLAPEAHAQQKPAGQQARATAPASGGRALDKRMAKLEDQIVDLQVVIGTLQSLLRGQGAAAPSFNGQTGQGAFGSPGDQAGGAYPPSDAQASDLAVRMGVIETQIRALTGQMEQISQQLSGFQAGIGQGETDLAPPPFDPGAPQPPGLTSPADRRGEGAPTNAIPATPTFGTLTVTPQNGEASPPAGTAVPQPQNATLAEGDSRALYERAYGQLLQRNFVDAERGFQNYLTNFPTGSLAPNAHYWLGETHYARGQYRVAADIFLTGYRKYRTAGKAPDSLLKLGMSLHQLGENDAACATLGELAQNFPRAPQHVRQQANAERRRVGC